MGFWIGSDISCNLTICPSFQTDNHTNISSLNFLQAGCSYWCPTNSVEALKAHCVSVTSLHSTLLLGSVCPSLARGGVTWSPPQTESALHCFCACLRHCIIIQCFDAVGWAAGRASGLQKLSGGVQAWLSVWSEVHTCIWPS